RYVARNVVLALAKPDEERTALTRGNELVGIATRHDSDPVRAFDLGESVHHGLLERVLVRFLYQVREYFRVGLRHELVAECLELAAQKREVFDDAVVHYRDGAIHRDVRVRIAFVRRAVGCPARVSDSNAAGYRHGVHDGLEPRDLARSLPRLEPVSVHYGDSGRVVATVLEPLEALEKQGARALVTDITDNSAHEHLCLVWGTPPEFGGCHILPNLGAARMGCYASTLDGRMIDWDRSSARW